MRKSIVFFLVVFFVALTGGIVVPSAARADDNRGTMEQQMACTPDGSAAIRSLMPIVSWPACARTRHGSRMLAVRCSTPATA